MSTLIGRKREQEILEKALHSKRPELIAIYGRRRIGKTFLVREYYKNAITFELTGLQNGSLADQLENFYLSLAQNIQIKQYPSGWMEAFNILSKYINRLNSKKKKIIFIDEFPWLATRKSKFLMAFEYFWNSLASKRNDLVLIICGSAASFMVKNIVRNKGGLYNRLTDRIRLLPFNLEETAQYLKSKNIIYGKYDIIRIYMVIGGIPFYLEKLQRGESVDQAIDRLCFRKEAPLRREFTDIFASLFENYERHKAIVTQLANCRKGLSRTQIAQKCKLSPSGRLTSALEDLEESGFIESFPVFKKIKKDALYRINDEFSMFYLKFIEKSTAKGKGSWLALSGKHAFKTWCGFAFETLCIKHIEQIKTALGISGVYAENHGWLEKHNDGGAQIDLLIDRADNVINVCEIKFYIGEFTITKQYAQEIRHKVSMFRNSAGPRKNIFITFISTYGLKENKYSLELVQNSLIMNDLFTVI